MTRLLQNSSIARTKRKNKFIWDWISQESKVGNFEILVNENSYKLLQYTLYYKLHIFLPLQWIDIEDTSFFWKLKH